MGNADNFARTSPFKKGVAEKGTRFMLFVAAFVVIFYSFSRFFFVLLIQAPCKIILGWLDPEFKCHDREPRKEEGL